MAFHIVTDRCFLVCEKVTSVILEEIERERPAVKRRRKPRKAGKKLVRKTVVPAPPLPLLFNIKISYYPVCNPRNTSYSSNNPLEEYELNLNIEGKEKAFKLYTRIIKEVQDQHPNETYLDKLIDEMLTGEQATLTAEGPNAIIR